MPLKIRNEVIGVLSINNKISGEVFNEMDLEIATVFAAQTAIAIENANLYANMQRSYISTVRALSAAIVRVLDEPELGTTLGAAARRLAIERFSLAGMADRYLELFERLLALKPSTT